MSSKVDKIEAVITALENLSTEKHSYLDQEEIKHLISVFNFWKIHGYKWG
jgi:hypothetical protein